MRILFYIGYQDGNLGPSVNTGGGTEIALTNIAKEMAKKTTDSNFTTNTVFIDNQN